LKSYISIHDVAPQNIDDIQYIIHTLNSVYKINKICILVIPGLNWSVKQIKQLRRWQNDGIEIAAHGWYHRAATNKTFYHKIHSLLMSDNCAEHLSKNSTEIFKTMNDSYNWFIRNGFQNPILYVPPAWALGKITKKDLSRLSFTHYECTTGIIHKNKYCFLPLLGFEEKTYFRAILRRFFNSLNYFMAHFTGIIRISIHPDDFKLYLNRDIRKYLSRSNEIVLLSELT